MTEHLDRVLLLGAGDLLAYRMRNALAAAGHAVTVVDSRWAELGSSAFTAATSPQIF